MAGRKGGILSVIMATVTSGGDSSVVMTPGRNGMPVRWALRTASGVGKLKY